MRNRILAAATTMIITVGLGRTSKAEVLMISTCSDLQNMKNNLSATYALANDIDCQATSTWNGGQGFDPVGTASNPFSGTLNGNDHAITNLYINRPSRNDVGLLGRTSHAVVQDVSIGGTVTGNDGVGGLVGSAGGDWFHNLASDVHVRGHYDVGGLIGSLDGTVDKTTATGAVTGVSGSDRVGGLVGLSRGLVLNSYATGQVSGTYRTGGLIGMVFEYVRTRNCYATGSVVSTNDVSGGLIGYLAMSASVSDCFSVGNVSGPQAGGLVGFRGSGAMISNGYWLTGTAASCSAVGASTGCTSVGSVSYFYDVHNSPMNQWDLLNIWLESPGSFPTVRLFGQNNTPAGNNVTVQPIDAATGTKPATFTFLEVWQAGDTRLTISNTAPSPVPPNFLASVPPAYFGLSSTARFSEVTVCIDYGSLVFSNESRLRLFHLGGSGWVDRTLSLDTAANSICAKAPYGYAFAIFESVYDLNTPVGNNVTVRPADPSTGATPVTLTFDEVTSIGATLLTVSGTGPAAPERFRVGVPPTYYDVTTTAAYAGSVTVCIDYSAVGFGNEAQIHEAADGCSSRPPIYTVPTCLPPTMVMRCGRVTAWT